MIPNSKDNNILGINKIIIKGDFTSNHIELINNIFSKYIIDNNPLTVELEKG